jgi:hypothetical protein
MPTYAPTVLYRGRRPTLDHKGIYVDILDHYTNYYSREYELITEAHTQLSVVGNCSRSSLRVCLGEGKQLAERGRSAVIRGGGGQYTGRGNLEQFRTTES